ncbi:ATP-binding cassette domain-containing protein [Neopusillimonas aromaticivorans]|uniref:ATP-binding cassette domain-containing protein n=1 Tax=Neopusillimonas aromaticivorans TaxID=2979868 RepID=UPI0033160996
MSALLKTHALNAFYGDFQALFGIDFEINAGETIAIIGANGAGKSTFLKSITGLLKNTAEAIEFKGRPIGGMPPAKSFPWGLPWFRRGAACSPACR